MKRILWIVNTPFSLHFELLGKPIITASGGWYKAAYDVLKDEDSIELHIVALSQQIDEIKSLRDEYGNTFYLLPGTYTTSDSKFNSIKNRNYWEQIRELAKPDIVQLWGTEYQHGLCALRVMHGITQLVYIQGVLEEIAHYYLAGIDKEVYRRNFTIRNLLKNGSSIRIQKQFYKRAEYEREILQLAKNVIVENDWCEGICKSIIGNGAKAYRSMLPINKVFSKFNWEADNFEPYTIFTNAGGYNIKGHHFLFEALAIVKTSFPEVKVRIPGPTRLKSSGWKNKIKFSDYDRYLLSIINKYDLTENIEWMGTMRQEDMAQAIAKSHIYVMPSAIENHSSSLIEAMFLGMPCVSSFVGGVNDFAVQKQNCLLYRFDDVKSLAANIIRLFENKELCHILSSNAINIRKQRNIDNIKNEFIYIYDSVING